MHIEETRIPVDSPGWLWMASIWLGVGLFDATQTVFSMRAEGMHHAWVRLFMLVLFNWLPLVLATPIVLCLGRMYPPAQWRPLSTWCIHVATCISICLVVAAWSAGWEELLNPWMADSAPGPFLHLWLKRFNYGILSYLILYASILAIGSVLNSRQRLARQETEAARLSEQLSKAQLHALRQQIEPHFLFNTLNGIAGLVREGRNDAAVSMIAELSDFLRRVVQDSERQEVTLGEEMEFLQKYLNIQKIRFADRLQVSIDVPRDLFSARVPSLLLQPIVENAVKHGIAKRVQAGTIGIAALRSNGMLVLSVSNDGPDLPEGWREAQHGIGISNLRKRLRGFYQDEFSLELRNQDSGGVEASVSLPYRER